MKIKAALVSDIGRVRKINQDNFYFNKKINKHAKPNIYGKDIVLSGNKIFAVMDGMGGEDDGEKASYIAAKTVKQHSSRFNKDGKIDKIIYDANKRICKHIEKYDRTMGTTIAVINVNTEKQTAIGTNVGDTKIFLIRDGKLRIMSKDHNISAGLAKLGVISEEEAWKHEDKNKLTQYLGIFEDDFRIEPYITDEIMLENGDIIILCTDGLTDGLSSDDIVQISNAGERVSEKCENMLLSAMEKGSRDNITILMIEII